MLIVVVLAVDVTILVAVALNCNSYSAVVTNLDKINSFRLLK